MLNALPLDAAPWPEVCVAPVAYGTTSKYWLRAGRDVLERLLIEVRARAGMRRVDHRRLAGDRDRLLQRSDAQLLFQLDGAPGFDADALAPNGREARHREGDGVDADRQVLEPVEALGVGGRGRRPASTPGSTPRP